MKGIFWGGNIKFIRLDRWLLKNILIKQIEIAIRLSLYCMKTQIFLDGNKRSSIIFANHYLISHGGGFIVIPEKEVPEFKKLLVKYYEGEDISNITSFMKERCWKTI